MVDIVQSVERQIVDLVVAGSSPVIHPIQISHFNSVIFLLQVEKHETDSNQGSLCRARPR